MKTQILLGSIGTALLIAVGIAACSPVENSSSLDRALYGNVDLSGASPQFIAVRTSLQKCQACHGAWLSLKQADFLSLNLVVANSPENSKLYYRNSGVTVGPGPHNMPSGGYPTMTATELTNMETWINSL